MNDQELTTKINILPGDTDAAAAEMERFNQRIADMRQRTENLDKELTKLERHRYDDLLRAFNAQKLEAFNREMDDLRQGLIKSESTTHDFADEMERAEKASKGIRGGGGQSGGGSKDRDLFKDDFGDASTGFGALGSAINSLAGSSAVGEVAAIIGDVTGFIEYLPALGTAIAGIGVAALPIIGIGAGVAGALYLVNQAYEESKKEITDYANALFERNRLQSELDKELANGNIETIRKRQEDVGAQIALEEKNRADLEARRAEIQKQYDEAPLFSPNLGPLGTQLDELDRQIASVHEKLAPLRAEFNQIATVTFSEDFNNAADTLKELGATDLSDLIQQEATLNAERDKATLTLQQLAEQERQVIEASTERWQHLIDQRNLSDERAAEDRAIAANYEQLDLNRRLEELAEQHRGNLEKIADDGARRIEGLQESIVEKQIDANEKIEKENSDLNKKLLDIDAQYQKEAERAAKEFADRRREIEEEYENSISDARLNFDVRGFLDAKRQRETDLKDLKAEQKEDKQSRKEQLQEERATVLENHQERIKQIADELQAFTDKTNAEILQTKQQSDFAIAEAERVYQERLLKDSELRAEQDRREAEQYALRQRRMEEDRALQDQAAVEQLRQQLADIETKRQAETSALNDVLTKIQEIREAAGVVGTTTADTTLNTEDGLLKLPPPPPTKGGGGFNEIASLGMARTSALSNAAAFASQNRPHSNSSTMNVTVQLNATVGDVPTLSRVNEIARELKRQITDGDRAVENGVKMTLKRGKNPTF